MMPKSATQLNTMILTTIHTMPMPIKFAMKSIFKLPVFRLLILLAVLQPLSACIPLVITAATVTAVDINLDRRTAGKYWDDNALELKLRSDIGNDATLGADINVSVTVFNGVVLLTGEVNSDEQRQRAAELVEKYKINNEVASIVNALSLAGKTNLSSRINDAWITAKIRAKLIQAKEPPASAVKVVTEHGKVYLLGRVTHAEGDAFIETISGISGITHIVKVFEYLD